MMEAVFTADFGEKRENEKYIDNRPYCTECGEPRFWESPDKRLLVRALCKCQEKNIAIAEKEQRIKTWLNRFNELNRISILHERYENSRFSNLDTNRPQDFLDAVEKVKTYTQDFLNGKKHSLYIYGKAGLGKTELMACIHNALKVRNIPVVFTSFMEIIKYITSSFSDDDFENRTNFENLLCTVDLLILDDLGVEYIKADNSFANEIIYNIVNGRYVRNKPTVFTSNHSLKDLNGKYQDRVIDRIAESKVKIKLESGETYRKTKFMNGD